MEGEKQKEEFRQKLIAGYKGTVSNKELERLKVQLVLEVQHNYQEQKNYCELTANLAKSPHIHSFFTDLLTNLKKLTTFRI